MIRIAVVPVDIVLRILGRMRIGTVILIILIIILVMLFVLAVPCFLGTHEHVIAHRVKIKLLKHGLGHVLGDTFRGAVPSTCPSTCYGCLMCRCLGNQ